MVYLNFIINSLFSYYRCLFVSFMLVICGVIVEEGRNLGVGMEGGEG